MSTKRERRERRHAKEKFWADVRANAEAKLNDSVYQEQRAARYEEATRLRDELRNILREHEMYLDSNGSGKNE